MIESKVDKIIEEQSDMKVELARLDSDIRSLREVVLPLRGGMRELELGQQSLKSSIAANDIKIETVRSEIARDIKEIKEQLKAIPHLKNFKLAIQVGAGVTATIVGMGFAVMAFVIKSIDQLQTVLNSIAGN